MKEYKKSFVGFWIWMLLCCISCFIMCFVLKFNTRILVAIFDNVITIEFFILTLIIYLTESVYWYSGITYEDAREAGSDRRKQFAFKI